MEKQTKQHVLCVISHTHWDREWYMLLEQMRLRLVDLIDRCLALLEREPTYIFHLDAQTVVLEDYLAIRCDRRERSARMIADGRLSVGPWYLQNDFYLTSGEATVRNLLEGTRLAESFGGGGLILRLLDLDTAARSAALDTDALLWRTTLSEKEDEPLDDGALTLRPKQLLTVRLCCREQENA